MAITLCLSALAGAALAKGYDGLCALIVFLIVIFLERR